MSGDKSFSDGGRLPVSDPTSLTTQHMLRETEAIRELIFREILALEKNLSTRMDAMDKATELLHDDLTQWPTELDEKISHLKELHSEKFNSVLTQLTEKFMAIDSRLKERDVRFESADRASKSAIDAAFQAAREVVQEQNRAFAMAVGKSENATSKQIDQLASQVSNNNKALDDKINDLKERFTRSEGKSVGGESFRQDRRAIDQNMMGLISLILGSIIGIAGLVYAFVK